LRLSNSFQMIVSEIRKKIVEKLKNRYRLIIYNDTTFQSVWTMKLSRIKVFTITSLASAGIVVLVIFLIAGTQLREYIPGYPNEEYRQMLIRNALVVDSLEQEIQIRDRFFQTINAIMRGEDPPDFSGITENTQKSEIKEMPPLNQDSIFQDKILEERLSLSAQSSRTSTGSLSNLHFFIPVNGLITNKFNATKGHYGIDLVSQPNARISAVLSGTVLFAGWTLETGYVLYIQHANNLVSCYKHNAALLKKQGDRVNGGEAIAIIGNTGEVTTGPHLHFELWHEGKPIDPERYIVF
jgi:murein DD-endopeptidase MepM/ murein hydrolase activator NlpD